MKLYNLFEATLNINTLIDYIYKEGFEEFVNEIQNYKLGRKARINKIHLKNMEFSSELLISKMHSPNIKNTLRNHPVTIRTGVFSRGSYYSPKENTIYISINEQAYDILIQNISTKKYREMIQSSVPLQMQKNFEQELNGIKIKATISHEISHWMRDALHGKQITKMVTRAHQNPNKSKRILNRGTGDDYLTDYEIDALIHGIKQTKRAYDDREWDTFTLDDLYDIDPAVNVLVKGFRGSQKRTFMRLLLTRMNREGLLGRNMK